MTMRVVLADDHQLVLDSLKRALEGDADFEVVGETHSGAHVVPLVGRVRPDIVLMDVRMPGMDGLTALDLIVKQYPSTRVVLISASTDPDQIQSALRRGATGYLVKTVNPSDVPALLRQAYDATAFFSSGGSSETVESYVSRQSGLTEREMTILKALTRGLSNKQISAELFVTEQTVKFHLSNIYRKLDVVNRAGAVRYATSHGLEEH
jgi:DNA-binding NarL/FixJ family response regulator